MIRKYIGTHRFGIVIVKGPQLWFFYVASDDMTREAWTKNPFMLPRLIKEHKPRLNWLESWDD